MQHTRRILLAGMAIALPLFVFHSISGPEPVEAGNVDVYVLYSSKEKSDKASIVEALGSDLDIKTYGTDKLKLSDYSGKQKAVAKIDKAGVVVLLGEGSSKILKGTEFASPVFVLKSAGRKALSSDWNLNIVADGTDVSELPHSKRHVVVDSVEALDKLENVLDAEAISVKDADRNLFAIAAKLIDLKLDE